MGVASGGYQHEQPAACEPFELDCQEESILLHFEAPDKEESAIVDGLAWYSQQSGARHLWHNQGRY